jgi:hypothetical protein
MVKIAAVLLLLANAVFFAWHQGHLAVLGLMPTQQREPERVNQQLQPQALSLLKPEDAKKLEAAANKPPECYVSPPLEADKLDALRAAMPALAASAPWQLESNTEPARWIAYMGKYANAEAVAKKKNELRNLGVAAEAVRNPSLEPGISLGGGATKAEADQKLADAVAKGVRTGKVLEEKPAGQTQRLRLSVVDDALRAKWPEMKAAGGFAQFINCKTLGAAPSP